MKTAAKAICEKLVAHQAKLKSVPVMKLFQRDNNRFENFSLELDGLLFDYSKNHLNDESMALLFDLAEASRLESRRKSLFAGEHINFTEDRAVMHMALRNRSGNEMMVDGHNVMDDVLASLDRMESFANAVRSGAFSSPAGPFTDIVNIGIGGSDLGPVMASQALKPYCDGPRLHFVSNIDGDDLHDTLAILNPVTTLFIVASKTFTTQETMTNANSAKAWLADALGKDVVAGHFVALSTNLMATRAFGIDDDRAFGFWDWVGGRYSLWSAIGLSLMIGIGAENFRALLEGGHLVDHHFASEPLASNIPVIMALIGIWHRNICGYATHAILPYAQHLHRFPAYLQQLDMESNGKRVTITGDVVDINTGPVIWGEPGTNGQHAFFQLIHQGSDIVPVDFLLAVNPHHQLAPHHEMLVANCLAQSQALMVGKSRQQAKDELLQAGIDEARAEKLAPHRVFPGNRPSSTFMFDRLTPHTLGMLIALYEHKVFVQGAIWQINSFDQWGVELGKQLANDLLAKVSGKAPPTGDDASTAGLLARFHQLRDDQDAS